MGAIPELYHPVNVSIGNIPKGLIYHYELYLENTGKIYYNQLDLSIESNGEILMKVLPISMSLGPEERKKVRIYYQSPIATEFIGKFISYLLIYSEEICHRIKIEGNVTVIELSSRARGIMKYDELESSKLPNPIGLDVESEKSKYLNKKKIRCEKLYNNSEEGDESSIYSNPRQYVLTAYEPIIEENQFEQYLLNEPEPLLKDDQYKKKLAIPSAFYTENEKEENDKLENYYNIVEKRYYPKPTAGWGNPTHIPDQY